MLRAMKSTQGYPYARVVREGNKYVLYIGYWNSVSEAAAFLEKLKQHFKSAVVYSVQPKPGAISYGRTLGDPSPQNFSDNIYQLTPIRSNILEINKVARENVVYSEAHQDSMAQGTIARNIAHAGEPEYRSLMQDIEIRPLFLRMTWTLSAYPIMVASKQHIAASVNKKHIQSPENLQSIIKQQAEQHSSSRDAAGLTALAQRDPGIFSCQNINLAWSLADAYSILGKPIDAERLLQHLLNCPLEQDRLATIYKARNWLDADRWENLLAIEEKMPHSPLGEEKFQQLRYDYRLEKLLTAHENNNRETVEQYFLTLAPDIEARKDANVAMLGAWNYYQQDRYGQASVWFKHVLEWDAARYEALQGLALCALKEKRFDEAIAYAKAMPATMPDRPQLLAEARSGLIEPFVSSGNRAIALQHLDKWADDNMANDLSTSLHLAGLFINFEEYARAQKLVDPLLVSHPNHPLVLNYAWQIAQHAGRLDQEIDYLKRSLAAEQSERNLLPDTAHTLQSGTLQRQVSTFAYENIGIGEFGDPNKIQRNWKEKKLAALIDRRSDWFSSAIDIRSRSGTAGLSQFNSVEIPLEYKTPWHADDEVFFRADIVKLNAGKVDPANTRFGILLFSQELSTDLLSPVFQGALAQIAQGGGTGIISGPKGTVNLQPIAQFMGLSTAQLAQVWLDYPARLTQSAQGVGFTAGYHSDDLLADIGTTPLDFPVSNVVGGITKKGDIGQYGYSIEASRRPVTSSLLSYAGTRDPFFGWTWGGVVATGGRVGLSHDKGETFGFWSSAGLHSLTGKNVQSNSRFQLMAGGQWRVINEENRLLSLGLTGMYWHHTQNAGEYTFGHGGYYSPLNYRSLSLPITFAERFPRFSYLLRAAVSASQSQMRDAPYYPTFPPWPAGAVTFNGANVSMPFYVGGPGHGTGQSLKAAWEYQVEPKLFVGGSLSIDRSESYAPNRLLFYMRYSLDHPGAQPVFMPPESIEPSSQF